MHIASAIFLTQVSASVAHRHTVVQCADMQELPMPMGSNSVWSDNLCQDNYCSCFDSNFPRHARGLTGLSIICDRWWHWRSGT